MSDDRLTWIAFWAALTGAAGFWALQLLFGTCR